MQLRSTAVITAIHSTNLTPRSHLRYPNSHTQYFSCTLLLLFAEANQEAIQEQITRVLLERLIVNRPHPWGECIFNLIFEKELDTYM